MKTKVRSEKNSEFPHPLSKLSLALKFRSYGPCSEIISEATEEQKTCISSPRTWQQ